MKVEIVTPDRKIFEGEAEGVQVPGSNGSFEVLKNHAPIISNLVAGKVKVREGKENHIFSISGGLVEVSNNNVIILADSVEA
jgi:F-type H+-transporting ATPase subunit epsilon